MQLVDPLLDESKTGGVECRTKCEDGCDKIVFLAVNWEVSIFPFAAIVRAHKKKEAGLITANPLF